MWFAQEIKNRTHIKIVVKTNKPKTKIISYDNGSLKMDVKALPIEGKANNEIIRFFKKNHKLSVQIVSGKTSNEKLVKILF